jgi:hypothetical protein
LGEAELGIDGYDSALLKAIEMPLESLFRDRTILVIPPSVSPLVAAHLQNRAPIRIEGKQDSPAIALALDPQFFQVREDRPLSRR